MSSNTKPGLIDHARHILGRVKTGLDNGREIKNFFGNAGGWNIQGADGQKSSMLIFSLVDWHYTIQIELILARLAEAGGCKAYLAGSEMAKKYWKAMGYGADRFVPWLELENEYKEAAAKEVQTVLSSNPSFEHLKSYAYNGVEAGKHTLSAVGRTLFRALFDPMSDDCLPKVRKHLTTTVMKAMVMQKIIDDYKVEQVLINEPNYYNAGISQTALANGRPFLQFCHAYQENAFVLKRYFAGNRAVNPISLSASSWKSLTSNPLSTEMQNDINAVIDEKYSGRNMLSRRIGLDAPQMGRDELVKKLGLDPARRTAVVFSHVLWDANMFWGKDLYEKGAEEWLIETVRLAMCNKNMNWIIKVHPANVWKMKQAGKDISYNDVNAVKKEFGQLPDNFKILLPEEKVNPLSLFQSIDVGVTIMGTVGIELPVFGVPCITAGTGRYSAHGFTLDPVNKTEYENMILNAHKLNKLDQPSMELARKYFWGIYKGRVWQSSLYSAKTQSENVSDQRIVLKPFADISSEDRRMIEFMSNTGEEDYFSL